LIKKTKWKWRRSLTEPRKQLKKVAAIDAHCAPRQEYLPRKQMPCSPFGFCSERGAIFKEQFSTDEKVAGVMKEEASLDLRSV
jgi:hypothetical protein